MVNQCSNEILRESKYMDVFSQSFLRLTMSIYNKFLTIVLYHDGKGLKVVK